MRALEETGLIEGYHARLNALALGYEVTVFAMVSESLPWAANSGQIDAIERRHCDRRFERVRIVVGQPEGDVEPVPAL